MADKKKKKSAKTKKAIKLLKEEQEESNEDEEIVNLFKKININSIDLINLVNDLIDFYFEFKSLKNINSFLTLDNFDILKKLSSKDNIKINLILKEIYLQITSNQSLYSDYLLNLNEYKSNLLIQIIVHILLYFY